MYLLINFRFSGDYFNEINNKNVFSSCNVTFSYSVYMDEFNFICRLAHLTQLPSKM